MLPGYLPSRYICKYRNYAQSTTRIRIYYFMAGSFSTQLYSNIPYPPSLHDTLHPTLAKVSVVSTRILLTTTLTANALGRGHSALTENGNSIQKPYALAKYWAVAIRDGKRMFCLTNTAHVATTARTSPVPFVDGGDSERFPVASTKSTKTCFRPVQPPTSHGRLTYPSRRFGGETLAKPTLAVF